MGHEVYKKSIVIWKYHKESIALMRNNISDNQLNNSILSILFYNIVAPTADMEHDFERKINSLRSICKHYNIMISNKKMLVFSGNEPIRWKITYEM